LCSKLETSRTIQMEKDVVHALSALARAHSEARALVMQITFPKLSSIFLRKVPFGRNNPSEEDLIASQMQSSTSSVLSPSLPQYFYYLY
jgi:hypothetical protein